VLLWTVVTATTKPKSRSGYFYVIGLWVLFTVGVQLYSWIDSTGWISHREDSLITAKENWFVGESKECRSVPASKGVGGLLGKPEGYAYTMISCDNGPEHNVKITFWGKPEQPGYEVLNWRCTRESDSFTCKQLGAER
jgi:hypothetical protein